MRKLAVVEFVTLDGVMQGLGGPDEDRDGGFEYGGWSAPYGDPVLAGEAGAGGRGSRPARGFFCGRRAPRPSAAARAGGASEDPRRAQPQRRAQVRGDA